MLDRFNRRLTAACEVLAGAGTCTLAVLVTITVFMRFVIGSPPYWAEELPRLVLVWSALIGTVVCSQRGSHLNAGLLPLLVRKPSYRRRIGRVSDLLLLLLFCVLGKAGWDLSMITMSQTTTALQLPAGILYLAVPVCCTALALVHLGLLLHPRTDA